MEKKKNRSFYLFNDEAPAAPSTAAVVVAVALDWFAAALMMLRRAAAALVMVWAAACITAAATVGTAHGSRLRLRLEEPKEPGRDDIMCRYTWYMIYLIFSDISYHIDTNLVLADDPSSSSACRFLLPQVQPTQTGFGFGFGLKKNLKVILLLRISHFWV